MNIICLYTHLWIDQSEAVSLRWLIVVVIHLALAETTVSCIWGSWNSNLQVLYKFVELKENLATDTRLFSFICQITPLISNAHMAFSSFFSCDSYLLMSLTRRFRCQPLKFYTWNWISCIILKHNKKKNAGNETYFTRNAAELRRSLVKEFFRLTTIKVKFYSQLLLKFWRISKTHYQ